MSCLKKCTNCYHIWETVEIKSIDPNFPHWLTPIKSYCCTMADTDKEIENFSHYLKSSLTNDITESVDCEFWSEDGE